jgi:hypothetical protein
MEQVLYKAKVPCRIGGAYRRAGDIFPLPKFETVPHFLEECAEGAQGPGAPGPHNGEQSSGSAGDPSADSSSAGLGPKGPRHGSRRQPGPMPEDLPGVVRDN